MLGFQALGRRALGQITTEPGILADSGAFVFSGQVAALSTSIGAGVGSFAFTGQAATLTTGVSAVLTASVGSFVLSGQDAVLYYDAGRNFVVEPGAFVLSGQDTRRLLSVSAGTGAFTITGQGSTRVLSIRANAGAFAVAGAVTFRRGLILYADNTVAQPTGHFLFAPLGSIALGGSAAALQAGTTFAWTGQDIDFGKAASITAAVGAFVFTFPTTTLASSVYPSKIRAFPRVARGIRGSSRGGGMTATPNIGKAVRARAFGG